MSATPALGLDLSHDMMLAFMPAKPPLPPVLCAKSAEFRAYSIAADAVFERPKASLMSWSLTPHWSCALLMSS